MKSPLKFPEWYYGGPYLRVQNPDSDLPVRDPAYPVSLETQARIEWEGTHDGERYVPPFRDANSIDEMLSSLSMAAGYPGSWTDDERYRYPTIQGELASIALRLEIKARHKPGRIRSNWFTLALAEIGEAARFFTEGKYEDARRCVSKSHNLIEQGNRASRRKVSFVVGPDGASRKL